MAQINDLLQCKTISLVGLLTVHLVKRGLDTAELAVSMLVIQQQLLSVFVLPTRAAAEQPAQDMKQLGSTATH
jgi:hypothetical protein